MFVNNGLDEGWTPHDKNQSKFQRSDRMLFRVEEDIFKIDAIKNRNRKLIPRILAPSPRNHCNPPLNGEMHYPKQ